MHIVLPRTLRGGIGISSIGGESATFSEEPSRISSDQWSRPVNNSIQVRVVTYQIGASIRSSTIVANSTRRLVQYQPMTPGRPIPGSRVALNPVRKRSTIGRRYLDPAVTRREMRVDHELGAQLFEKELLSVLLISDVNTHEIETKKHCILSIGSPACSLVLKGMRDSSLNEDDPVAGGTLIFSPIRIHSRQRRGYAWSHLAPFPAWRTLIPTFASALSDASGSRWLKNGAIAAQHGEMGYSTTGNSGTDG